VPFLFRHVALNPFVLRKVYARTFNAKKKFAGASPELFKRMMDMEIILWHANDVRTHMRTTYDMLTVDNCKKAINLPLWHVSAAIDQYFDEHIVEQHLKVIFPEVHIVKNTSLRHAPSVVADVKEAAEIIPQGLRRVLSKRS